MTIDRKEDSVPTGPLPTTPRVNVSGVLLAQDPIQNPLHAYASYTYNLSLHMLSIDEYNQVINSNFEQNDKPNYVPKNVIISSAGRYNDTNFKRNSNFIEDFYFEDFKMQTVITPNMRNRNTNMIECSFTIIEPNGFTLINRMIAAANQINTNKVNAPGSYAQLPYVLQIDFFGYTDLAESKPEKITDLTKIIPIRITNVETQLKNSGAEYKVEAVAFNHQAFSELYSALPFHTIIQSVNVAGAFNGGNTAADANSSSERLSAIQNSEREVERFRQIRNDPEILSNPTILDDVDVSLSNAQVTLNYYKNKALNQSSICGALTGYYLTLKKSGQIEQATEFRVIFDPEIGNSSIKMVGSKPTQPTTAGTKTPEVSYDGASLNISPGTTIPKLIDFVVRNSEYVLKQIYDVPGGTTPGSLTVEQVASGLSIERIVSSRSQPLSWFKIVPTMKIGEWDNKLNRYVPIMITYYVKKFTINSKYPYGPNGRVPGYVKKYDYLFTGKNQDVIDWNINFNTLYLLAVTAGLNKTLQGTTGPGLSGTPVATSGTASPSLGDSTSSKQVATSGVALIADKAGTPTVDAGNPRRSKASGDLSNSLLLDARGDMIELELKIIGDPHFIKQDDVFYNRPGPNENQALTPNKSLYMDTGELYIFVNFLSPVDYNEEKGIAEVKANELLGNITAKNTNLGYSNFSGVYKLITVDSMFVRGKFEQTLRMAKVLSDQDGIQLTTENFREREERRQINVSPTSQARPTSSTSGAIAENTVNSVALLTLTPMAGRLTTTSDADDDILPTAVAQISTGGTERTFSVIDIGWSGSAVSLG